MTTLFTTTERLAIQPWLSSQIISFPPVHGPPLDAEQGEIRVLLLLSGALDDGIQCRLVRKKLGKDTNVRRSLDYESGE